MGTATAQPRGLSNHSAVYDPLRQGMILFGGVSDSQDLQNDVWRMELGPDPRWRLVSTAGTPPSQRTGQSAIYDPVRERMIVFGGYDGQLANDVWALGLADSTWTLLQPAGTPPPTRLYHTAVYDPVRDRMVVFGGDRLLGNLLNDVWVLWLDPSPRWERVFPSGGSPSPRRNHAAIYDPLRDRMIVFGGNPTTNDLWALSFGDTSWSQLAPSGALPPPRFGHTALYDPSQDRMVVFGGFDGNQYYDDLWTLSLGTPSWNPGSKGFGNSFQSSNSGNCPPDCSGPDGLTLTAETVTVFANYTAAEMTAWRRLHQLRDFFVLKRLMLHHMTPVTRRITDAEENRLVISFRHAERRFSPRIPINGVVRVLEQVRTGLVN